jgi:phenylacetate-CoA ligase
MSKLLQFQIIQKEKKKYELRLIVSEKYSDSEEIARNRLKSYLGSDAIIEVNFVDEIPLLKTGKRKIVINEMIDG